MDNGWTANEIANIITHLDTGVRMLRGEAAEAFLSETERPSDGGLFIHGDQVCLVMDGFLLLAPNDAAGRDILRLLQGNALTGTPEKPRNRADALRLILTGKVDEAESERLAGVFGIHKEQLTRLIVFRNAGERMDRDIFRELESLFPLAERDSMVRVDPGSFVVLHETGKDETTADIAEYALALCETAENEAEIRLNAGVSPLCGGVSELRDSYSAALDAISVGKRFHRPGPVWVHDELILEHFLDEIPASVCERFRNRVMTEEARKALNDEMLETVNMFFRCDLNLSDTARQMFIHRNTLMYRLDKIEKVTGLDLRRFHDATVFRILMEFPDARKELKEKR